MEIRRATRDDIGAILTIVRAVAAETYGGVASPLPIADPQDWTFAWVALADGAIAGATLTGNEWIDDLWIASAFRTRGVGSALLARAESEIAARGHASARIRVLASNFDALAFYKRSGYTYVRTFAHEKLPVDMIELTRRLPR